MNKLRHTLSAFVNHSHPIKLVLIAILALSIPITLTLVARQQDVRQRAQQTCATTCTAEQQGKTACLNNVVSTCNNGCFIQTQVCTIYEKCYSSNDSPASCLPKDSDSGTCPENEARCVGKDQSQRCVNGQWTTPGVCLSCNQVDNQTVNCPASRPQTNECPNPCGRCGQLQCNDNSAKCSWTGSTCVDKSGSGNGGGTATCSAGSSPAQNDSSKCCSTTTPYACTTSGGGYLCQATACSGSAGSGAGSSSTGPSAEDKITVRNSGSSPRTNTLPWNNPNPQVNATCEGLIVSWNAPSQNASAIKYEVGYGLATNIPNDAWEPGKTESATTTTHTIKGLIPGVKYNVVIDATSNNQFARTGPVSGTPNAKDNCAKTAQVEESDDLSGAVGNDSMGLIVQSGIVVLALGAAYLLFLH